MKIKNALIVDAHVMGVKEITDIKTTWALEVYLRSGQTVRVTYTKGDEQDEARLKKDKTAIAAAIESNQITV